MRSEELRIAKTESKFRDVNERIAETTERVGGETAELVCECADPSCGQRLEVSLEDYEATRASGKDFIVAPGHEVTDLERVTESRPGYQIIQKLEGAGRAADRLDPRKDEDS